MAIAKNEAQENWENLRREMPLAAAVFEKVRSLKGRFHVPGHQGVGLEPLGSRWGTAFLDDLTELEGLDNLAVPTAAIAEAQRLAAKTFGADRSWFLVNGSTVGLQAALLAVSRMSPRSRQKIIIGRNAHQSILTGLVLSGLCPVWVQPEVDYEFGIATHVTAKAIAQALADNPDAGAVCIVSPTYYGTTSNVEAIAQLCHKTNIPLIVDEAHGGHFVAHPCLPQCALAAGANIVVQSAHKTLGSLTQSALLHSQEIPGQTNSNVLEDSLSDNLRLLQSSSPSYLLMTSLDVARSRLQSHGYQDWHRAIEMAQSLGDHLSKMSNICVLNYPNQDPTRVIISAIEKGWNGYDLDEYLDQRGIAVEIGDSRAIGLVITPQTRSQSVDRLIQVIQTLPKAQENAVKIPYKQRQARCEFQTVLTPREAWFSTQKSIDIRNAVGEICAEWVCPYPPGIPVLLPGEKVTTDALKFLQTIRAIGGELSGLLDPTFQTIQVVSKRRQ
ncbi:MAG: aminotransferase class V-fold PLP-dependent enzyme [Cyanobacteria bacterium P01_C01_bin.89]